MNSIDLAVLRACNEAIEHQREILALLSSSLNIPINRLLYEWVYKRVLQQHSQHGEVDSTEWSYFFHGYECDLKNIVDGRFLRIDFGPHGRVDTFTSWGILQFIMTSKHPWSEFKELKTHFAKNPPPYDQFSGSYEKINLIWDAIEEQGLIEKADQNLLDFAAKHTHIGADGLTRTEFPSETPSDTTIDCAVASRYTLSQLGKSLLDTKI